MATYGSESSWSMSIQKCRATRGHLLPNFTGIVAQIGTILFEPARLAMIDTPLQRREIDPLVVLYFLAPVRPLLKCRAFILNVVKI
jgi:hypothetical protein